MHELLREKLAEVLALCQKHDVARLWAFGSAVNGDFDLERSDFDFLVEWAPQARKGGDFFQFLFDLEYLFGRKVDLVEKKAIKNPFFVRAIKDSRVQLYAA